MRQAGMNAASISEVLSPRARLELTTDDGLIWNTAWMWNYRGERTHDEWH